MGASDQPFPIPERETLCSCTRCDARESKGQKRHRVTAESFASVVTYPAVTVAVAGCRCKSCRAALVDAAFAALAESDPEESR